MCKLDKVINDDSEFIIWIILLYSQDGLGGQDNEDSLLVIWSSLESYHDI